MLFFDWIWDMRERRVKWLQVFGVNSWEKEKVFSNTLSKLWGNKQGEEEFCFGQIKTETLNTNQSEAFQLWDIN